MEMIDLRREDGTKTGEVKERTLVHRDGDLHGTSHVWLVRYRPSTGSADVLLQKRSADKDSFPGYYDISSAGHIPAGQDFLESAVRELKEELGVEAAPEDLHFLFTHLGYHEQEFYGKLFKNHEYSRVYLYECDRPEGEFRIQKSEVESVRWMDYRECLDGIRNATLKQCIFPDEFESLRRAWSSISRKQAGLWPALPGQRPGPRTRRRSWRTGLRSRESISASSCICHQLPCTGRLLCMAF